MKSAALKAVMGRPNETQASAPTRGFIVGWEQERGVLVELSGSGDVVLAQSLVELSELDLSRAVQDRRPVLVTFEDADRSKPVILGLLADLPAVSKPEPAAKTRKAQTTATISEELVIVRGRESIELRCGAASITLHKDGKILLRGTYVLSRASKENRIAGGSVHFN